MTRSSFRSARISDSRRSAARLRSMAPRMASNSTSSLNGFVRNSTAPAFIACTVIGTSPWPVMKMIGMSVRSASCFCSSRPLSPGSVTSSTRQHGTGGARAGQKFLRRRERFGLPAGALISSSNDSRTETSSSTTKTIGGDVRHGEDLDEREAIADITVYGTRATVLRAHRCHAYLIRSAMLSASSRAVSLNGLNRHSTAPCASRRGRTVLSPLRGDEDNRNLLPPARQFLLQIGARHARHCDVENQAARLADELRREERLRR